MKTATVVIGANYGDEGKGLAAFFTVKSSPAKSLNVLINGGAQRGHTVDLPDSRRHIFHHFGSGCLAGADSYADRDFILNPLVFNKEFEDLESTFNLRPHLILSDKCRVSLPYDMMLGQIVEENRGANRHGSCGLGIFETRKRYENGTFAFDISVLKAMSENSFVSMCECIAQEYIPERLESLNMRMNDAWKKLLSSRNLMFNSFDELRLMLDRCEIIPDMKALFSAYDNVVFEAGQGLMLDELNAADFPYLTPSRTTSLESIKRIKEINHEVKATVMYVTRSYFTRHGAGPLKYECSKESINPDITDRTNVPNPHQLSLRYAPFNQDDLLRRLNDDLTLSRAILPKLRSAICVTHLNETNGNLYGQGNLEELTRHFDEAYLSDNPYSINPK